MKKWFIGIRILCALVLSGTVTTAIAEGDIPPLTVFQSLNTVGSIGDFGWQIFLGNEENAKMTDQLNLETLLLEPVVGDAFLAIAPQSVGGITVFKEILGAHHGKHIEVDWAVLYQDDLPFIDSGFIYVEDVDSGNVFPIVTTTLFDGSSIGWNTTSFGALGDGLLRVTVGALNGFDTSVPPIFLVGDVRLISAPVPIPASVILLGTALASIYLVRRHGPS